MSEQVHHPSSGPVVLSTTINLPDWIDQFVDWSKSYDSDDDKMELAIGLSRENVNRDTGGPFGAAIFDRASNQLLGVGVNQVVAANNSTLHGEVLAIMMAEQSIGSFTLANKEAGTELFSSCEPCAMCFGAVLWSGVNRMVCAATGDDARAIGFDEGPVFEASYRYLEKAGIEVVRGLQREQANQVLRDYLNSGGHIYNG